MNKETDVKTNIDLPALFMQFLDMIRNGIQNELPETITLMHIKALNFVQNHKDPSMRDVSEQLNITSAGTTLVVDKLVENGELERIDDINDRRVIRLRISDKGRIMLDQGLKIIKGSVTKIISRLDKNDSFDLSRILEKLITIENDKK